MPSIQPPFTVLRSPAWPTLVRRVEAAVERSQARRFAADTLLRPPRLLEAMAADAPGALGEEVLRADRLRVLLHACWPYAGLVAEAKPPEEPRRRGRAAREEVALPEVLPYELGVIDPGALMLLAVAAIRVAPPGFGPVFLSTVHGLALSASAAETLGRLDPEIPDGDAMSVVLQIMELLESVESQLKEPLLRPFASDPVERGRWACLARLLGHPQLQQEAKEGPPARKNVPGAWDGAFSYPIQRVRPPSARPGQKITLELGSAIPTGRTHVVLASADGKLRAAAATPSGEGQLEVTVPKDAAAGWIGFSDEDLIEKANGHRAAVKAWLGELANEPCLRGQIIPTHRIPTLGLVHGKLRLSTPPRIGTNHYGDGRSLIAGVTVRQGGSDRLRQGAPLEVGISLQSPVSDGVASVRLSSRVIGPQRFDGAYAELVIPTADARDGMSFVVVVSEGKDRTVTEEHEVGPLELAPANDLTVVLFLTAVAPHDHGLPLRLSREQARRALDVIEERLRVRIDDVWLPWSDDLLAGIGSPITSADDTRAVAMLQELSRRALLTPGLEHAVWLALLPGEASMYTAQPAAAARRVGVATLSGLPALFAGLQKTEGALPLPAPTPRLRILGSLGRTGAIDLEWVQEDTRAAGPGPQIDVGLSAVTLDEHGNELASIPIRALSSAHPIRIGALVPITATVDAVELRQLGRPLARIPRTAGQPRVQTVELVDGTLRWRYSHSEGALPMLQLALAQQGLFTPVESLDPCDRSAPVRLTRFGGADDVLVLANDGWNVAVQGGALDEPFKNATPVVLRQLEDGRYWADVPEGWAVRWSLDGVFQGTGLTLALAPGVLGRSGILTIVAQDGRHTVEDSRPVGGS